MAFKSHHANTPSVVLITEQNERKANTQHFLDWESPINRKPQKRSTIRQKGKNAYRIPEKKTFFRPGYLKLCEIASQKTSRRMRQHRKMVVKSTRSTRSFKRVEFSLPPPIPMHFVDVCPYGSASGAPTPWLPHCHVACRQRKKKGNAHPGSRRHQQFSPNGATSANVLM